MTGSELELSALIPAAGLSGRMHHYKPLLKLGSLTLIEKVILLFQECGVRDIVVVTGHNREKIEPLIQKSGARAIFNPDFRSGMLSSIQRGVQALSPHSGGFFLLPADIPLIRPSTIHTLVSSALSASLAAPSDIAETSDSYGDFKTSGKVIIPEPIIPQFNLEDGHPPLIPAWLIPEILSLRGDSTLGELIMSRQKRAEQVHDRGIMMDADTQSDYELLKQRYQTLNIPDSQECQSIINATLEGEEIIKAHLNLVAETAMKLAEAVKAEQKSRQPHDMDAAIDPDLYLNLIMAGALLHDIRRREKHHADAGAKYLLSLGFPEVADIVAQHMDLNCPLPAHLTEAQIVYFADKLCSGTTLELDYWQRFKEKMAKNPDGKSEIARRYEDSRQIHARIEAASGRSIKSILCTRTSDLSAQTWPDSRA